MSAYRFTTGKQFDWNGSRWEVKRPLPEGKINIEEMNTTAIKVVDLPALVEALFAGDLKFVIETRPRKPGGSPKCLQLPRTAKMHRSASWQRQRAPKMGAGWWGMFPSWYQPSRAGCWATSARATTIR